MKRLKPNMKGAGAWEPSYSPIEVSNFRLVWNSVGSCHAFLQDFENYLVD